MKKATKIIIIVVVIIIALLFVYNNIFNSKLIDTFQENKINPDSSTSSYINSMKGDFIPNTNYTCEDLILEKAKVVLIPSSGYPYGIILTNKNMLNFNFVYNKDVGQKVTGFKGEGGYAVRGRVSDEGVILRDYYVKMNIYLDDDRCSDSFTYQSETKGATPYKIKECEILGYSCSWGYCKSQDPMQNCI
jgi:hypothetical protein